MHFHLARFVVVYLQVWDQIKAPTEVVPASPPRNHFRSHCLMWRRCTRRWPRRRKAIAVPVPARSVQLQPEASAVVQTALTAQVAVAVGPRTVVDAG